MSTGSDVRHGATSRGNRSVDAGLEARVDEEIARVHQALQRLFRLAGPGSVGRVEKAMGIGAGTIGTWRRRQQLNLRNLFRILYHLGDPAHFWALAYPHVPLAERPPGPVEDPVVRALRDREAAADGARETRTLSEDELRRIDGFCGDEPKVALRKSKAALKRSSREQWPALLGFYGSAQLALGRLREALDALHLARALAEDGNERTVHADVLRRLGDAYAAAECHTMAMLFVKEAWHQYRLAEDAGGEARCLTVLADRLDRLGQHEEADLARAAASRLTPEDAERAGAARAPRPPSSSATRFGVRMQPGTDTAFHGHRDLLGQAGSSAGGLAGAAGGGLPYSSKLARQDQEDWVDESLLRVHRVLRKFFAFNGWGSIRRTEQTLGIGDGGIRKWRTRRLMKLRMLLRLLDRLGSPAHFWCEVYPATVFARRVRQRTKDRAVRQALQLEQQERRGDLPRDSRTPETLDSRALRRLDELRYDNPRAAAKEIRAALLRATRHQRPTLLAFYGSARRAEGHHDKAVEVLQHALELALNRRDRELIANILRRLGSASAYSGNHSQGLLYAKEATYQFRLADDAGGEGRSLVDQGLRLGDLGQLEVAVAVHELALSVLPVRDVRHRFAVHSALAVNLHRRGNLRRALRHAVEGSRLSRRLGKLWTAVVQTTMAEIHIGLGDQASAERCYEEAVEIYALRSPIDAALASVDLARIRMARGRTAAAANTLKAMGRFVEKLDNPLVRAAMVQLMRMNLSGRVTGGILEQAARVIHKHQGTVEKPLSGRRRSARSSARPR
ncbi:MAG: tetratricopeptide repeat protein [Thermoanaerobaculia bacterium]